MKVFMIGGTGLLGSDAAGKLIEAGHEVLSIALPPIPQGSVLPKEMKIEFGNYLELSDEQLLSYMEGCEGFVFAAGVDERVEGPAPIYDLYKKFNIDSLRRLLMLAKQAGIKHAVVLGSYFAYFEKTMPELRLADIHPYIRSRRDQEQMALSFADDSFDVAVLELPYIFGAQPGRKPVWMFLVEAIRNMPEVTYYPEGGTTMVSVSQVSQAILGGLTRNRGGHAYPIGYYNLTWNQFLTIVHKHLQTPDKPIINIPKEAYVEGNRPLVAMQREHGIDPGLNMIEFADLQCSNMFIDPKLGSIPLGVQEDDIDSAIKDSIQLCLDILNHKVDAIDMKGQ